MRDYIHEKTKKRFGLIKITTATGNTLIKMLNGEDPGHLTPLAKYKLKVRGLVEQSGESIKLTALGRWQAIARKMQLRPVEMFILADMYVYRYLLKDRCSEPMPYALQPMEDRLIGLLDIGTIRNKIWKLRRRGAIEKVSPRMYNITDRWVNRIGKYHDDVCAMQDFVRNEMIC